MHPDHYDCACRVVQRLTSAGFKAYFAGGWVRDYLLSHPSDDIDIATDAPPESILNLFPRTIHVGIAFGVVIVDIEGHQFEVATFRRDVSYSNGRSPDEIEMSSPEEDALRRDFTINGMFYDPLEDKIYDYVGGMRDLKQEIIRCIGNADERFKEDRLRMVRAIRFAHRFNFHIDLETQEAIRENCDTLFPAVAMERIWQEFSKMSQFPSFDGAIIDLHRLGLLPVIFPDLAGVHLTDVRHFVAGFSLFPSNTPTLLYILQLFPHYSLEQVLDLCSLLRLSTADKKLANLWMYYKQLETNTETVTLSEWAHFYAQPHSEVCIRVFAAYLQPDLRTEFLAAHEDRQKRLAVHIERIRQRHPILTSNHLQQTGIAPGVLMGKLLKLGEAISINEDLHNPIEILKRLRQQSSSDFS